MNTLVIVEIAFGFLAAIGLLAATRPETFAQAFLAKWQRDRLANEMGAVSWTGWVICGCALFMVIVAAVADVFSR